MEKGKGESMLEYYKNEELGRPEIFKWVQVARTVLAMRM